MDPTSGTTSHFVTNPSTKELQNNRILEGSSNSAGYIYVYDAIKYHSPGQKEEDHVTSASSNVII